MPIFSYERRPFVLRSLWPLLVLWHVDASTLFSVVAFTSKPPCPSHRPCPVVIVFESLRLGRRLLFGVVVSRLPHGPLGDVVPGPPVRVAP